MRIGRKGRGREMEKEGKEKKKYIDREERRRRVIEKGCKERYGGEKKDRKKNKGKEKKGRRKV